VPSLNIPSANQVDHRPKVLAMMDRQALLLSKVQSRVDLSYKLNLHHRQIADHLTFDSKALVMILIF